MAQIDTSQINAGTFDQIDNAQKLIFGNDRDVLEVRR